MRTWGDPGTGGGRQGDTLGGGGRGDVGLNPPPPEKSQMGQKSEWDKKNLIFKCLFSRGGPIV